jgi:hypothetical protein
MVEPIIKGTRTKVIAIILVLIATTFGGGLYVNSQLMKHTSIQTTDNSNKLQSLINAYPWIGVGLSQLNQTTEAIPIMVTGMYSEGEVSLSLQAGDGLNAMTEIVQDEVNAYCQKIGSKYRFDFVPFPILNTPQGVEISNQAFNELGVKMVVQDEWSISYNSTLSSIRNNGMLYLIGRDTSRTTDTLNGVYGIRPGIDRGDYCYAITSAKGVKALVVLERDWSPLQPYQAASMQQLTDKMLLDYEALGGKVYQKIVYTGPEYVNRYQNITDNADFSSYLKKAEAAVKEATAIYGEGKVGILVTGGELSPMIYQSRDIPGLMNVPWFGTELSEANGVILGSPASSQVGPYAEKVGFYIPVESVENKAALEKLKDELTMKTGLKKYWYGVQETTRYDGCWLLALSVIKADSTDAKKVEAVLPQVAAEYNGINGNYAMDEKGDKISYSVDIYKVYQTDTGSYAHFKCAEYSPLTGVVYKDTKQPLP